MTFDFRQKLLYIITSILVITAIMSYSIYSEIRLTKAYLSEVFDSIYKEIEIVTGDLELKAKEVLNQVQMEGQVFVDEKSTQNLRINTYPERGKDEYGFNQGIYPDTVAVGSLYGYGKIPADFNRQQFLVLDRIWSGYQASLLNTLPFLTNYKSNFIYLSSLNKFGLFDEPMFEHPLSPERYRQDLDGTEKESIDKNGYFITRPLEAFIDHKQRIFFLIPLFEDGEFIADLGNSVQVDDLINLLNLYPKLDKGLKVHLVYKSGIEVNLSDTEYKTWSVYSFDYDLPGDISITAKYDFMYFFKEKIQMFLVLLVLAILMFGYRNSLAKRKIHQQRLMAQLDIDPMTKLYNRRAIDNQILPKVTELKGQIQVAIIAIDADKFKVINDTYGHHIGDRAIKHIAKTMNEFIREGDYCIRMGGDEFMIVLFDVNYQQAIDISSRLTLKVESTSKEATGVEFSVTCAAIEMGVDEVFDQAYKRVDDDLYKNKKA